jgi:hypothetical protein
MERRHAELDEQPLETPGGCDCEKLRAARRDHVSMRDTARKGESVPGCKSMHVITDDDGDVAAKHDDLLVLALVHVQRKAASAWLIGLPNPKSTLALGCLHMHDHKRANKPQTRRFSTTRRHEAQPTAPRDGRSRPPPSWTAVVPLERRGQVRKRRSRPSRKRGP